jgi:hypothetical protein
MSQKPATPAMPDGAVRLDDLSDSQILALIERAGSDPIAAKSVQYLQKEVCERMTDAVQKMLAKLNGLTAAQEKKHPAGPMSVAALASAARQREAAGKQKKEFAELLVIGALMNRDNPDWNLFDTAAAPAPAPQSGVLALLKLKAPAPAKPAAPA